MNAEYQPHREFMMNDSSWPSFHSHLHTHCEIIYVSQGTLNATLDGVNYEICANEAMFILPHQIHSFVSKQQNNGYVMFVSPIMLPKHSELMKTSILENPIIRLKSRRAIELCNSIVEYLFESFGNNYNHSGIRRTVDGNAVFKSTFANSLVESYVSILLEGCSWKKKNVSATDNARRIMEYCLNNYTKDISLGKISEELGIAEATVTRVFGSVVKCPFRTYINNLRLAEVETKLKETDMPITKISELCGFETMRTFNRVFLSAYGVTPTKYRKIHKETNVSI